MHNCYLSLRACERKYIQAASLDVDFASCELVAVSSTSVALIDLFLVRAQLAVCLFSKHGVRARIWSDMQQTVTELLIVSFLMTTLFCRGSYGS